VGLSKFKYLLQSKEQSTATSAQPSLFSPDFAKYTAELFQPAMESCNGGEDR
jgi:hypothetical protein